MMWLRRLTSVFVLLMSFQISAEEKPKKNDVKPEAQATTPASPTLHTEKTGHLAIDTSKSLNIVYASNPWNHSSTKVDTAFLFMKDDTSGKVIKILLEETEPDSAVFTGKFSINWAKTSALKPSVYIPPQGIRTNTAAVANFMKKIGSGKVPRKPLVFKKSKQSGQLLDVFDTNAQATKSLDIHNKQLTAEKKFKQFDRVKKGLPEKATEEVAEMVKRQQLLKKLADEAAARESARLRKEQLARQNALTLLRKQKQMSEQQRAAKKKQAKDLAAQAIKLYQEGVFDKAETLFKQAVDLDPSNRTYYFFYGATLYRNKKYDEALIVFRLTPDGKTTAIEKHYFMALSHYRLSELAPAVDQFRWVKEKNDKTLSSSAAFYEGVILYNSEEYEKAKAPFEYILDNSSDPKLDEKAEAYLEKIANMLIFKNAQAKTHILSGTFGAMYDSNALFAPDNDTTGAATDSKGFRAVASGDYEYRALYTRDHEVSAKANVYYLYSPKDDLARSDMTLAATSIPYTRKTTLAGSGRGMRWTFKPGYELLLMDPDETGKQSVVLQSATGNVDMTIIMDKTWYASYILDVRQDNSHLALSDPSDNADALKYNLKTSHTFVDLKNRGKALTAHLGFTINSAEGNNKKYNRIELGSYYTRPIADSNKSWNAALTIYQQKYPSTEEARKDLNITLTGGYNQPINMSWLWGVSGSYSKNKSDVSSNEYSRYTLLTTATFVWSK